jgi:hypothetical protein
MSFQKQRNTVLSRPQLPCRAATAMSRHMCQIVSHHSVSAKVTLAKSDHNGKCLTLVVVVSSTECCSIGSRGVPAFLLFMPLRHLGRLAVAILNEFMVADLAFVFLVEPHGERAERSLEPWPCGTGLLYHSWY